MKRYYLLKVLNYIKNKDDKRFFCTKYKNNTIRSSLMNLMYDLNKDKSEIEKIITIFEENWYQNINDIQDLGAMEAKELGIPYRIIKLIREKSPKKVENSNGDHVMENNTIILNDSIDKKENNILHNKKPYKIPYKNVRVAKPKMMNYGLMDSDLSLRLKKELNDFYLFITTDSYNQKEPKIRHATAEIYVRLIKLSLGWIKKQYNIPIDSLSLHKSIFPDDSRESIKNVFQYIQWLQVERNASLNYCSNIIRAFLKLAKYLFGNHTIKLNNYDETKPYDSIEILKELRKIHKNLMNDTRRSIRASKEDIKWIDWPEFLAVVEELKNECGIEKNKLNLTNVINKNSLNKSIALTYQRCVMLGIFSSIPDRQRTLREIQINKTLIKNDNKWIIRHGPDDYKTGKAYGERPPLIIADHIIPYLEEFIYKWRNYLKPKDSHHYLFCKIDGSPSNHETIYRTFTRVIYRLTGKKTNPHLLRDSIVTYLRGKTNATEKEMEALAIYMGHSLTMQKSSYDRRTKSDKVAPAVNLLQSIQPGTLKKFF